MSDKLKILLFDIETAPSISYMWGLWQEITNYSFIQKEWFVLSWSAKWLGGKEVVAKALPDFKLYKTEPDNDKELLQALWKLLDEADVVIAHNGRKFDRKKVNARFVKHGITPPSPYRIIDTLEAARNEFAFTSNRLNDLAEYLGLGKKLDTGGFQLWKDCLQGKAEAWKKMVKYNKVDILLLEKVYLALRAYIPLHPHVATEAERACCPRCGSDKIHYRGYIHTNSAKYRKFVCTLDGSWGREKVNLLTKEQRSAITVSA